MGTPPIWAMAMLVVVAGLGLGAALYYYVTQGSRQRGLYINNELSEVLGRMVHIHLVEVSRVSTLPAEPCPGHALLGTWVLRSELCRGRNQQLSIYAKAYGRPRGKASESVLVVHDHLHQEWIAVVFGAIPPQPKCTTNAMVIPIALKGPLRVGPLDK